MGWPHTHIHIALSEVVYQKQWQTVALYGRAAGQNGGQWVGHIPTSTLLYLRLCIKNSGKLLPCMPSCGSKWWAMGWPHTHIHIALSEVVYQKQWQTVALYAELRVKMVGNGLATYPHPHCFI